jgi:hypothetical protein
MALKKNISSTELFWLKSKNIRKSNVSSQNGFGV